MAGEEKNVEKLQINDLHVYALLIADKSNDFDLQLLSGNDEKKFVFECIANLVREDSYSGNLPYLYHLKLTNAADGHTQLTTSYSLKISATGTLKNWHYQEVEKVRNRQWLNVNEVNHQFLFSIDFQRGALRTKPPCTGVFNWDHLWLYTYFIIKQNDLQLYDVFIDQFSTTFINFEQQTDIDTFFQQCFTYLPTIRQALDNNIYVSIILARMIGLLNIGPESVPKGESISYIDILLESILNKIEQFFNLINANWWLLIKDGLTNLLYFKFLIYSVSSKYDSITFINLIPQTNQYQQQVADSVAKKITLSNIKPTQRNWLDLFKMTTDDILILDCLQLANTFIEYINYAERLLDSKTISNIKEKLFDNLEAMLDKNHFQLRLEDIQLLFQALQKNCTDDMRNILEQSQKLPSSIAVYLNKLPITDIKQLHLVHQIFSEYYNPYLLSCVSNPAYFISTLTKHNFTTPHLLTAFYIEWFKCFLCEPHYTNSEEEKRNFQCLLDSWFKQFTLHFRAYVDFIKSLDELISMLEKNENRNKSTSPRLDIFFEKILSGYTTKEPDLIKRVNEISANVRNEKFLSEFKLHFRKTIVPTASHSMKRMDIYSPLYLLLQNTKKGLNIKLTVELMEICTETIKLDESCVHIDALVEPNENSFLSVILFDPYFQKFNIHQAAVNELKKILERKQNDGIQLDDLNYSRRFSRNQKKQFDKIWQYVQKFRGQQPSMEILLNSAHKEMEEKSIIKDKVQTCLAAYCKKADDIQQYQLAIDQLTQQLANNAIKSIQIPNEVLQLVPFTDILNPYNTSKTWLNFRQNEQNSLNISKLN
jgi:hypothetical protein